MRCFLSIPLSEEVVRGMEAIQKRLSSEASGIKLVERENMHMTIRFYGEIDERRAEDVSRKMDGLAQERFRVSFDRVDAFPNREHARVLWAGVGEGSSEIVKIGEAFGERNLIPHVTLARLKSKPSDGVKPLIGEGISLAMEAERLCLVESLLTANGPRYEVLHEKAFE